MKQKGNSSAKMRNATFGEKNKHALPRPQQIPVPPTKLGGRILGARDYSAAAGHGGLAVNEGAQLEYSRMRLHFICPTTEVQARVKD